MKKLVFNLTLILILQSSCALNNHKSENRIKYDLENTNYSITISEKYKLNEIGSNYFLIFYITPKDTVKIKNNYEALIYMGDDSYESYNKLNETCIIDTVKSPLFGELQNWIEMECVKDGLKIYTIETDIKLKEKYIKQLNLHGMGNNKKQIKKILEIFETLERN